MYCPSGDELRKAGGGLRDILGHTLPHPTPAPSSWLCSLCPALHVTTSPLGSRFYLSHEGHLECHEPLTVLVEIALLQWAFQQCVFISGDPAHSRSCGFVSLSPGPPPGSRASGPRHGAGSLLSVSARAPAQLSWGHGGWTDVITWIKNVQTRAGPCPLPQGPQVQFASAWGLVPTLILASPSRWCGEDAVMEMITRMMTVTLRLSHSGQVPGTVLVVCTCAISCNPKDRTSAGTCCPPFTDEDMEAHRGSVCGSPKGSVWAPGQATSTPRPVLLKQKGLGTPEFESPQFHPRGAPGREPPPSPPPRMVAQGPHRHSQPLPLLFAWASHLPAWSPKVTPVPSCPPLPLGALHSHRLRGSPGLCVNVVVGGGGGTRPRSWEAWAWAAPSMATLFGWSSEVQWFWGSTPGTCCPDAGDICVLPVVCFLVAALWAPFPVGTVE